MRDSLNRLIASLLGLLGILLLTIIPVLADSVGPTIAGTGADDASSGTKTWSNPTRITANDSSFATCSVNSSTTVPVLSHYLAATSLGFSIPPGATINGIQVDINRKNNVGSAALQDSVVQLLDGSGSLVGSNYGATSTNWPTTATTASYGGSADLWGTSLTYSDINSSSFGVDLQVQQKSTFSTGTANVDYIQITVWYTTSGGATQQQTLTMMGVGM